MKATLRTWIMAAMCWAVLGVGFFWPLWMVLKGGVVSERGFTLQFVCGVFENPIYVEGLINSLWIALGTTFLAALVSIPLAWLNHRYTFPGKRLFSTLILVPMILPPFVGAIGFQQIFGVYGAFNAVTGLGVDWLGEGRMAGVVILQAFGLYPIFYLNVAAALANIDPSLDEAAENMGCRGFRKFRRITLPLIAPGLFAGGTLVFIWAFTELGTPLIMNVTRCAPVQVFDALKEINSSAFPFALVIVMLAVSLLLYGTCRVLLGNQAYAMHGKATVGATVKAVKGWKGGLVVLPFVLVTSFALWPHLGVILTSFSTPGSWYRSVLPEAFTTSNYVDALGYELTLSSIRNSLVYSSWAVVFTLLLGLAIAWLVVRSSVPGRGLLDSAAMLPLAVPGLVMATGYLTISRWLANKEWTDGIEWVDVTQDPAVFLVLAYGIRRLPYMVRAAVAGLQQTSVTLEEAAADLGAKPLAVLRRISVPLIMANLIGGMILAFSFSMLEVSDSLMLAQTMQAFPITKTIYELFQLIGLGTYIASALGVWAMVFLAITILAASAALGKNLGALFRM